MSRTDVKPDRRTSYSTPIWVKVLGIIALVLVLLVGIIMFTGVGGLHGPRRHISPATPTIEVQQP